MSSKKLVLFLIKHRRVYMFFLTIYLLYMNIAISTQDGLLVFGSPYVFAALWLAPIFIYPELRLYTTGDMGIIRFNTDWRSKLLIATLFPYVGAVIYLFITHEELEKLAADYPNITRKERLIWVDKYRKRHVQSVEWSPNEDKMWARSDFNPETDQKAFWQR